MSSSRRRAECRENPAGSEFLQLHGSYRSNTESPCSFVINQCDSRGLCSGITGGDDQQPVALMPCLWRGKRPRGSLDNSEGDGRIHASILVRFLFALQIRRLRPTGLKAPGYQQLTTIICFGKTDDGSIINQTQTIGTPCYRFWFLPTDLMDSAGTEEKEPNRLWSIHHISAGEKKPPAPHVSRLSADVPGPDRGPLTQSGFGLFLKHRRPCLEPPLDFCVTVNQIC